PIPDAPPLNHPRRPLPSPCPPARVHLVGQPSQHEPAAAHPLAVPRIRKPPPDPYPLLLQIHPPRVLLEHLPVERLRRLIPPAVPQLRVESPRPLRHLPTRERRYRF